MKVCLCGSTRFMDQFHAANVALSLAGHIVYSVATSTKGDFQPSEDQKLALDIVHLAKIRESEIVMVVGRQEDGSYYIGESTRREIMYAHSLGLDVIFWNPNKAEKGISGPTSGFEETLAKAAETSAIRAARKAEAEKRQAEFMASLNTGLVEIEGDGHTGLPDCPACKKAEEAEAAKAN